MKKVMAIALVSILFASVSALALLSYADDSPAQKECKTCVFKAVGED